MIRQFIAEKVVPVHPEWEKQGHAPREFYYRLGELGCSHRGARGVRRRGRGQRLQYQAVTTEELMRAGVSFGGSSVHTGLVLPYLMEFANDEQKQRWMPDFVSGAMMTAIAMTEPGTGSDLAGIKDTAKLSGDGTHYVLNGARPSSPAACGRPRPGRGPHLPVRPGQPPRRPVDLVVDTKSRGTRSAASWRRSACAPPTPPSCPSPTCGAGGGPARRGGKAFSYLTHNLIPERLGIAVSRSPPPTPRSSSRSATQGARRLRHTVASFQNTKFVLAECSAEVTAARP